MNQGECYRFIHNAAMSLQAWCSRKLAGNDIGRNVRIALHAYIDLTNPHGVHIGDGTLIETGAVVLAHDPTRHFHTNTYVGRNCFIGMKALITAGVKIGDQSIIFPGSVVQSDVPPGSIVVGSPARIVRSGIRTDKYGLLLDDGVDAQIAALRLHPAEL
jgi:exopolysaccharide acyltransferase PssR